MTTMTKRRREPATLPFDQKPATSLAGSVVDELGELKARLADMRAQEDQLKARLAELLGGDGQCEGSLFRATVSTSDVHQVDWRAVAERLGPSPQLIAAHTVRRTQTTVRVVARTGEKS